jgi:hypothetical protein
MGTSSRLAGSSTLALDDAMNPFHDAAVKRSLNTVKCGLPTR